MTRKGLILALLFSLAALPPAALPACYIFGPCPMMTHGGAAMAMSPDAGPSISFPCNLAGITLPQAWVNGSSRASSLLTADLGSLQLPNRHSLSATHLRVASGADSGPPGGQARLRVLLI